MPLPLAAFLAASSWAAQNVVLSGQILNLALTAIQVLRAPTLWEGVEAILTETEYADLTDLLDWAIDELLTPAGENMPTGTVIMWGGELIDTPPDGWLICAGDAVSRETYAALFDVIGEKYGEGDGSTTFRLPDFRHKSPLGSNPAYGGIADYSPREMGVVGGEETHTLTEAEMPAHTHTYTRYSALTNLAQEGQPQVTSLWRLTSTQNTGSKGGSEDHNNMHPFLTVNFIIKT